MASEPKAIDFTAWFVLQGCLAAQHVFGQSSTDRGIQQASEVLARSAAKMRPVSNLISRLPYAWQYRIGDFMTSRGRMRHFYLRKQWIEQCSTKLLASEPIEQVVILGAGLDILSLKLAQSFSHAHIIEIDLAASQRFKKSVFQKNHILLPRNVELIEGDLRHPLAGILAQSTTFDFSKKTLWIAEGLFMFIPEDSVRRIFAEIRERSNGALILFTSVGSLQQGSALAIFIQEMVLKKAKSMFNWAIPFAQVGSLMQELGYIIEQQMAYGSLHAAYEPKESPRQIGEDIHLVRAQ